MRWGLQGNHAGVRSAVLATFLAAGGWVGSPGAGAAVRPQPAPSRSTQPPGVGSPAKGHGILRPDERYPYGSPAFTALVADSYRGQSGTPGDFYHWFQNAYLKGRYHLPGTGNKGLRDAMAQEGSRLQHINGTRQKSEEEIRVATMLHRAVKKDIPRFSLDRGFEFRNVVRYGERQCLLQAVLIAGMLQRMGMDAGTSMVYWSTRGARSNLGHVVTLLRLPDGCDVVVDASEQEPFPRHRGLFLPCPDYRFLEPVYRAGSSRISAYRPESGQGTIAPSAVRPLPYSYVRSQFYYYRGERVPGGLLQPSPSPSALRQAEEHLRTSVQHAPANPLAVYMLGRALLAEGKPAAAETHLANACGLYARYGWTPEGPSEFLAIAKRQASEH